MINLSCQELAMKLVLRQNDCLLVVNISIKTIISNIT